MVQIIRRSLSNYLPNQLDISLEVLDKFECEKCLNAYVFDYELTHHNKNEPNCEETTIYHKLREEAIAKEKQEQMERAQRQVVIDFNTKMKHLEKQTKIKERREIRLEKKDVERIKQLQEMQEEN